MAMPIPSGRVRFGAFEVDLRSGELHKQGIKIKLHDQPFLVLTLLLEHPGELVTREQLRQKLWPADTFVDFDVSLNSAIKRLRDTLSDTAERPRYVETLPRRGYRFIAAVERIPSAPYQDSPVHTEHAAERPMKALAVRRPAKLWIVTGVLAAMLVLFVGLNIGELRQRLLRTSAARTVQSVAVLPLENLSGDPEQEYFADGMTEALITDLGKIRQLRVISRTSVTRYKGTKKPLQEIARELRVDALVEGTVARSGDRVRITANLVQASPEKHLWADSFERDLSDVLALQDDVSRAIANGIQIRLTPQEQVRLASAHRVDPQAYQSYLRGLYFWNKLTPDSVKLAVNYFQTAIEKDPEYAPAYASLANCYSLGYLLLDLTSREAYPRVRTAATKAVALDENSAEAHVALGNVSEMGWDWSAAQREFRRAIQLDPNRSYAHLAYGYLLLTLHKPNDAWTELKTAQSLDPVSQATGVAIVISLNYSRRYDEAITVTKQWLQLYPDSFLFHTFLGDTYVQKGMESLAVTEYLEAEELLGSRPSRIAALRKASRTSGLNGFWRRKLALDQDPRSPAFSTYDVARDYAALRDRDNCLLWLEKSYSEKDSRLIELSLDPCFDSLRSDPRFQDLLRRIGLPS
jgi:TolB-like protein/DNA-binding winged helix-turn-helix (wHTH) protein